MKKVLSLLLIIVLLCSPAFADYEIIRTDDVDLAPRNSSILEPKVKRLNEGLITAAIEEMNFTVDYPFTVYLTDYAVPFVWGTATHYHITDLNTRERTTNTVVVIHESVKRGPIGRSREDYFNQQYHSTVVHELGHVVYYNLSEEQINEYRQIRGLPTEWSDEFSRYREQPTEIFADDFRVLFGGSAASVKPHLNRNLTEPTSVEGLKEFMNQFNADTK